MLWAAVFFILGFFFGVLALAMLQVSRDGSEREIEIATGEVLRPGAKLA